MIMDRANICLLLPNRPLTYGDKVGQLRRRANTPRCLFGPPDPAETERLLQEQVQRERERFQRRWNIDLDSIEAAFEKNQEKTKATEEDLSNETGRATEEDSRIPTTATEVEARLSFGLEKEKTSKSSSTYVPNLKICKKPCSKYQKRIRVAGGLKRQTHLTEFWRSRRSISFVFGKIKARPVSLPEPSGPTLE